MTDKISFAALSRRKVIDFDHTPLPRVLTLFDLTTLGIGTTIGVGFYILAGDVAQSKAGPAVTISFLIAAITSVFAGLCYAEFGGRVPKAGSAYIYTYVCIGEFIAFIIGWNLILEYVIATASVASGYSHYIDAMANDVISEALEEAMPMNVSFLGPYPDFLAAGLVILLSVILAFGVKESSFLNNIMTIVNMFVVVFVIICTATLADPSNWSLSTSELNETCRVEYQDGNYTNYTMIDYGSGGFAPYGFSGIMAGAAACFYGFVGFDVIASTGEEAIKPERTLPLSICLSLFVIFLSYFGLGTVLTMALPYCLLDNEAPLVKLYEYFDMNTSKIIVSVGALFGFSASLFGAIFPMPRIIYAMASDGLLFRWLAQVNERFHSPIVATFVSGGFAAVMATFFDLEALINMMSIGTLQAYSIVALCVMLLRYAEDPADKELELLSEKVTGATPLPQYRSSVVSKSSGASAESFSFKSYMRQAFNPSKLKHPTPLSASYVAWATVIFCVLCFTLCILLVVLADELADLDPASMFFCIFFFVLGTLVVVTIYLQPQSAAKIQFRAPFVPWLPSLSCFFNLYLMCNLPPNTWVKFVIWLAVGFAIYFFYGVCHADVDSTTSGRKSTSGVSNQAFENDSEEPVIPKILVQPATPMLSMANTPTSTMVDDPPPPYVRMSSREAVISPLVTAELAQKQLQREEEERARKEAENGEVKPDVADDEVIAPKEPLVVGSAPLNQSIGPENEALNDGEQNGVNPVVTGIVVDVDVHQARSTEDSDVENEVSDATSFGADVNSAEMKTSHSAPVMPLKSASLIRLTQVASEENLYVDERAPSSVPATPVTKRPVNLNKPLRRMSSFDFIPPSSPTDPLAKKVNGFYVIPVKESDFDGDGKNGDHQQVRKTSSLDEIVKSNNESDLTQTSSEPILMGSAREFSHGLGQELGKESIELGVIRERGESKVLANDETFNAIDSVSQGRDESEKMSNSGSGDVRVADSPKDSNSSPQYENAAEESSSSSAAVENKKAPDSEIAVKTENLRPHFDLGGSSSSESLQTVSNLDSPNVQSADHEDVNSSFKSQNFDKSTVGPDLTDAKDPISSDSETLIQTGEPKDAPVNERITDSTVLETGKSEKIEPVSSTSDNASNPQQSVPEEITFQNFVQTDTSAKDSGAPMSTDSWAKPLKTQSSIKNLMQKFSVSDDSTKNIPREPVTLEKDSAVSELRNKFQ